MADHTPGPWHIRGKQSIRGHGGEYIAKTNWQNGEANARLIAAAPDLLEALETSLAFVAAWAGVYQLNHELKDFHPKHAEVIAQIKVAIAKATGAANG